MPKFLTRIAGVLLSLCLIAAPGAASVQAPMCIRGLPVYADQALSLRPTFERLPAQFLAIRKGISDAVQFAALVNIGMIPTGGAGSFRHPSALPESKSAWTQHLANLIPPVTSPVLRIDVDMPLLTRDGVDVLDAIFKDNFNPAIFADLPSAPARVSLSAKASYTIAEMARAIQARGLSHLSRSTLADLGQSGDIPMEMVRLPGRGAGRHGYTKYRISPEVAQWLMDLVSTKKAAELLGIDYQSIFRRLNQPGQARAWGLVIFRESGEGGLSNELWHVSLSRITPLIRRRYQTISTARGYRVLREHHIRIAKPTWTEWLQTPAALIGDKAALEWFGRSGPLCDEDQSIDLVTFARLARYLARNQRILETGVKVDELAKRAQIGVVKDFYARIKTGILRADRLPRHGAQPLYRIPPSEAQRILGMAEAMHSVTENLQALGIRQIRAEGLGVVTVGWDVDRLMQTLDEKKPSAAHWARVLDQVAWYFDESLYKALSGWIRRSSRNARRFLPDLIDRLGTTPYAARLKEQLVPVGVASAPRRVTPDAPALADRLFILSEEDRITIQHLSDKGLSRQMIDWILDVGDFMYRRNDSLPLAMHYAEIPLHLREPFARFWNEKLVGYLEDLWPELKRPDPEKRAA